MRIIISPAKKMKINSDSIPYEELPELLPKAEKLLAYLKQLSYSEIKTLWNCSDKIAGHQFEYLKTVELKRNLTPALLAYDGIQYQYMAPIVFETDQWSYIKKYVRILSGFYGILRPIDGIVPYRLEMKAKIEIERHKNLYEFWGDSLYQILKHETNEILNLASEEYAKCIKTYLEKDISMISVVFGQLKEDKIIQKGVLAKMARGEMVRYLAEHQIKDFEEIKNFNRLHYSFDEKRSSKEKLIFLQ